MVGAKHDADLDEPHGVRREPPLEPQQADGVADARPGAHQLAHGDPAVGRLLAAVVADGGDDVGGRADDALLLGGGEVEGERGRGGGALGPRRGGRRLARGDEPVVGLFDGGLEPFERVRDHRPGLLQGPVLRRGGLGVAGARTSPRVAKLHLGLEERRAGPRRPGDDGLCDLLGLESVDQGVLVDASQFLLNCFFLGFFKGFCLWGGEEGGSKERGEGEWSE